MGGLTLIFTSWILALAYSTEVVDRFFPELGIQFAHKGYINSASSHFVHMVRFGGLSSDLIDAIVGEAPRQNL